jgi:hypothetical protein
MTEDIIDRLKEFMERPGFHAKDDLLLVCDAIGEIDQLRALARCLAKAIDAVTRSEPSHPEGVPVSERIYEE